MIYSPEMIRRIEAVTSSLRGVIRSRVESEGGVVHRIRVAVEPDKDSHRAAAEVRSALLSSLGVEVEIDEIDVRVVDASQAQPRTPGAPRPPSAEASPPEGEPARPPEPEPSPPHGAPDSPDAPGEPREPEPSPPAAPPEPEPAPSPEPGPSPPPGGPEPPAGPGEPRHPEPEPPPARPEPRRPERAPAGPTGKEAGPPPLLRFVEFAVFGGGDEAIELRVRIVADGEVQEGSLALEDLDALDATAFVHAALRAAESALDARPAGRSGRILLLEPVDVEETELREGSFAAVTVEARLRHGRRRATGFAPLRGSLRETSAQAALDAVSRLLASRSAVPPSDDPNPDDAAPPIDPFDVWD